MWHLRFCPFNYYAGIIIRIVFFPFKMSWKQLDTQEIILRNLISIDLSDHHIISVKLFTPLENTYHQRNIGHPIIPHFFVVKRNLILKLRLLVIISHHLDCCGTLSRPRIGPRSIISCPRTLVQVLQMSDQVSGPIGTRPIFMSEHFMFWTEHFATKWTRSRSGTMDVLDMRSQLSKCLMAMHTSSAIVLRWGRQGIGGGTWIICWTASISWKIRKKL